MLKEKKKELVNELTRKLSGSALVIAANYQGSPARQAAEFRSSLAKEGIEYHVVKNTLLRLAAERAGKPQLMSIIEGPVALAFGYNDPVNAAKIFNQYLKSTGLPLQVRGGLLGERVLLPEELVSLSNLPPREALISRLIGQLLSPLSSLQYVLSYPLQGLLNVLQRRAQTASN